MSPLAVPPNRGYADYQRIGNYDSAPLFNQVVGPQNTQFTSGILDVSRYAYLGGRITPNGGDFSVQLTWFADAAGTITLNWRTFQITPNIAGNATLHIPNLGPFVQLQLTAIGGANYTTTIVLIGTNRVHPLEFIPRNPLLLSVQNLAIAANSHVIIYPSDYYAGPVQWLIQANVATPWAVEFDSLQPDGTYPAIYQLSGNSADTPGTALTPPGAWRAIVYNTDVAAHNFWFVVTPSMTGAT